MLYERERRAAESPFGAWEVLIQPLQMLLFLLIIRVGLKYLSGLKYSHVDLTKVSADLYFDPFISCDRPLLVFPFRPWP